MAGNCALHNKAGLERFYSPCNESELHFVRRAGIHKNIIMNYTQGGRQVQLQTLWIEQFGSLVIISYGRWCRNSLCWCGGDSKADHVILAHACFVIFPERKDETWLCPGGNVFSLHGCGARASGLIKSIFLPQCCLEIGKRAKTQGKRARVAVGGELINLMAFVAHQTLHFSPCCLSSQPEKSVSMMKSYELENKKNTRDEKAADVSTDSR